MTLNQQLEEMRKASWGRWAPEKAAILYRSFEELTRSGILERALKKGDRAPDFTLKSTIAPPPTPSLSRRGANGEEIRLSNLLKNGPVVLAFYRGHW